MWMLQRASDIFPKAVINGSEHTEGFSGTMLHVHSETLVVHRAVQMDPLHV